MSGDEKMLGARVPSELKALVDADPRQNQEIVRAALWREFGGERRSALERRIEEKQRRMSMIESERNERERELQQMQQELKGLQAKLEQTDSAKESVVNNAVESMGDSIHPDEGYDHAAAENWADKAEMDVDEFWAAYTEAWYEAYGDEGGED